MDIKALNIMKERKCERYPDACLSGQSIIKILE